MAVPKHKVSKAAGRSRRAANRKATVPTIMECPQCHETKAAHAVCPNCGYYNGEKKMLGKLDEKAKA